jgi:hypothetical protein
VQQVVAGAAEDLHVAVLLGGQGRLREEVGDAHDRVHRRADLVAHAREEIGLALARALGDGLGLLQLGLDALALGHVARGGEDALQRAAAVVECGRVVRHDRFLPVARAGGQLVVGDLLLGQHQLDRGLGPFRVGEVALERRPISSSRVQPVSASICLLTSVMIPEGSVVMIASMLDSISERV